MKFSLLHQVAVMAGVRLFEDPPVPKKCLHPGCEIRTTHRGGYCCPEHKKGHKTK